MLESLSVYLVLGPWPLANRAAREALRAGDEGVCLHDAGSASFGAAVAEVETMFGLETLRAVVTVVDVDKFLPLMTPRNAEEKRRCAALISQIERSDTICIVGRRDPRVWRLLHMLVPASALVTPDYLCIGGFKPRVTPYASRCHSNLRAAAVLPPLRQDSRIDVLDAFTTCFRAHRRIAADSLSEWPSTLLRSFGVLSIDGRQHLVDQRGFGNLEIVDLGERSEMSELVMIGED